MNKETFREPSRPRDHNIFGPQQEKQPLTADHAQSTQFR